MDNSFVRQNLMELYKVTNVNPIIKRLLTNEQFPPLEYLETAGMFLKDFAFDPLRKFTECVKMAEDGNNVSWSIQTLDYRYIVKTQNLIAIGAAERLEGSLPLHEKLVAQYIMSITVPGASEEISEEERVAGQFLFSNTDPIQAFKSHMRASITSDTSRGIVDQLDEILDLVVEAYTDFKNRYEIVDPQIKELGTISLDDLARRFGK